MFDRDHWREIIQSLKSHRLRTFLTGFGVFWGIFMLILLLGVAKGVENGFQRVFNNGSIYEVSLIGGKTTLPYQGLKPGRQIDFTIEDVHAMPKVPGIALATPVKRLQAYKVRFQQRSAPFNIVGQYPSANLINKLTVTRGRLLNALDLKEARRVAVVDPRVIEILFPPGHEPLGETIAIEDIPFRVVGVLPHRGERAQFFNIQIPFSTLQQIYDPNPSFEQLQMAAEPGFALDVLRPLLMHTMAKLHRFDRRDTAAIDVADTYSAYRQGQAVLSGIHWFSVFIGLMTLLGGCVGVSNIMLVSISERTREFGIRKSLGATPGNILAMVLHEAVTLILAFGLLGLSLGAYLIGLVRKLGIESDFFTRPEIDPPTAVGTLAVLLVAGLLAGFLPARQAVRVTPAEAMRHE
jgi:putative ABC transport system permease protein